MGNKTLGQVAFEAYLDATCEEFGENVSEEVDWRILYKNDERHQRAWQAVAEAVLDVASGIAQDEALTGRNPWKAERAVIEAAEALFDGYRAEDQLPDLWKTDPVLDGRLYALFVTLEAMQQARKGGE